MKLDLIAIGKLSPAGLWDLAELAALISTLRRVAGAGLINGYASLSCWAATVRLSQRMLVQYQRQLRVRTMENFHMRIKAWVLQCPDRIAHVRSVIGETAIKKWRQNRLLDYTLTQTFGDWKSVFPNGLKGHDKQQNQNAICEFRHRFKHKIRAYIWKPFALVKIVNATRILFGQTAKAAAPCAETLENEEHRAAYSKLWNVDIADTENTDKSTQPRQPRAVNPVRFTPDELVPQVATDSADALTETPEIFPPPELEQKIEASTSEEQDYKPQEHKPQEHKPP